MFRTLEIVTLRDYLGYTLLGLACGLAGTTVGIATCHSTAAPAPTIALADHDDTRVAEVAPAHEDAPPPPSSEVHFVFASGGVTYMAIQDLDSDKLPRHGKLQLAKDDYVDEVVATVSPANVTRTQRAWLDREVIVDTTCRAKVTGFAIVGRVNGYPSYTDEGDGHGDTWTSAGIVKYGHDVLAAKLDHCTGTYARDAASAEVVAFEAVSDDAHVAAATRLLLASAPAADAAAEWTKSEQTGTWYDSEKLATLAVRDPRTGVTWISVHGHPGFACGGPDINVWGLFRVEHDGSLVSVQLRTLGDLITIDKLVDIDGDGIPELLGETWLGPTTLLTDAGGTELGRLEVPFIGCPC